MFQLVFGLRVACFLCICNFWLSFVISSVDGYNNETAFPVSTAGSRQTMTSSNETTNDTDKIEEILILALIPYTSKVVIPSYLTGTYYASSLLIAADEINDDTKLLPGRRLRVIFSDSQCLAETAVQQVLYQWRKLNIAAIIGAGCDECKTVARIAGSLNIPIVSHVSKHLLPTSANLGRIMLKVETNI